LRDSTERKSNHIRLVFNETNPWKTILSYG
jgi:hypothetical protein